MKAEIEVIISAAVVAIVGGFALVVLYAAGMYKPIRINEPQYSALGTCPDCHLIKGQHRDCSELKGQAWIDCTNPDFVEKGYAQK